MLVPLNQELKISKMPAKKIILSIEEFVHKYVVIIVDVQQLQNFEIV